MNVHIPKKIEAPGVYDLTNEEYHGDCCLLPSISASGIKALIADGPAEFWRTSALNPEADEREAKPAFRIGSAAHTLLLEPEKVEREIAVIPHAVLATNGAASTSAAKEFIGNAILEGRTPIKPSEWKDINDMKEALARHPYAKRALTKGRAEVSLIMQDPLTGVMLKSRPDFMPDQSGQYIVDYKTTASLENWQKQATVDLRYDIQAALSLWAAKELASVEAKGVLYLVQEKKAPFTVGMLAFTIDNLSSRAILDVARMDMREAINLFAGCIESGVWPSPWDQPREIAAPGWHQRGTEFRLENTSHEFADPYTA